MKALPELSPIHHNICMVEMAQDTAVVIDEEEYSLVQQPRDNSALVLAERKELSSVLELEALVEDLGKVGGFIRIAYNATAGAGPSRENHELHMKIEKLGFDITDLCSKSTVTVANFRSTTRTILEELKSAYEYLLAGYEDMAVDSMACLSTLAKKMAEAAWELHDDFTQQYHKVQGAIAATKGRKVEEELEKINLENRQKELDRKIARQKEIVRGIKEKEKLAREERELYERKEDDEIGKIKVGILESVCDAITSIGSLALGLGAAGAGAMAGVRAGTTGGRVASGLAAGGGIAAGVAAASSEGIGAKLFGGGRKAAEKRAALYKEKVKQKLEEEKAFWDQRQASILQQDEFLSEMETCKDKQSDTEIAIKFLHQASGSLLELAVIMQRAATFWMHLQQYCLNLAEDGIKGQIEKASKYTKEEKKDFWRSDPFKRKAVAYYAKWVALNGMCHDYLGKLRVTQEDLRRYIRENPTREEARESLPELIKTYRADLKQEQGRILESRSLADAKSKMLDQDGEQD